MNNMNKDTEKLTIYLPITMKREIKALAAQAGISVSQAIEYLITGALMTKDDVLKKLTGLGEES